MKNRTVFGVLMGSLVLSFFYSLNNSETSLIAVSEGRHDEYSVLATKSVNEFSEVVSEKCGSLPASSSRDQCILMTATSWVQRNKKIYSEIPNTYITGIDLANALINKVKPD